MRLKLHSFVALLFCISSGALSSSSSFQDNSNNEKHFSGGQTSSSSNQHHHNQFLNTVYDDYDYKEPNHHGSWLASEETSDNAPQSPHWKPKPAEKKGSMSREGHVSNNLEGPKDHGEMSHCRILKVSTATIPQGQTEEDIYPIIISDGDILSECPKECCKLGPSRCQYAWIFKNKCLAVSCSKKKATNCLPKHESGISGSIYIHMAYTRHPTSTHSPGTGSRPTSFLTDNLLLTTTPPPQSHIVTHTTHPSTKVTLPFTKITPPPNVTVSSTHSLTVPPTVTPPPSPPTSSKPKIPTTSKFSISFAGNLEITLPEDSTHIYSSTWPTPKSNQKFVYHWEKVKGPNHGFLNGIDHKDLLMSELEAGVYVLKLSVRNQLGPKLGEATVNVTVHPPVQVESPPTPVINPPDRTVVLPRNSALFDASGSHDYLGSNEHLVYHWEEVEGPVDSTLTSSSPILHLTNLKQGNYRFKLTVTDSNGLSAVAHASLLVKPEPYYPPQALAGKDLLIKLPNDKGTLDGSESTAFKGKLKYSWVMLTGPGSLDMKGTDSPRLHLFHISSVGDYLFQLTVTDSQGQSSSANVSVVVIPEHNLPPVANAGADQVVSYPHTTAHLTGNASTDDFKIDTWRWTQLSGPQDIKLSGVNSSFLKVEGLHIDEAVGSPTHYQFELCVWDYHNLTDTSNVTISYTKNPRVLPRVSAGLDVNISLPQSTVILNGSSSYDDFGISSYQWMRSENSPAAGIVMEGSDKTAILMLSGLVEGTYNFTLTVTNKEDVAASSNVSVTVLPHPMQDFVLQVYLDADVSSFTLANQKHLQRVLGLILDDIDMDYETRVVEVRPFGPHVLVEFYAVQKDDHTPVNALQAYQKLTKMGQDYYYPNSNFHFVKINMKVCQLPCSGHGSCDKKTHKCKCVRFWMENPIKAYFGKKETNCDWSIFYVVLAVVLCVAVLLFLTWLACCCCMRKRRIARTKRRVRYAILDHNRDDEEGQMMLPRDGFGYQQTSLMVSESETEEEILFESSQKENGSGSRSSTRNGTVPLNVQVRSNRGNRLPNGSVTSTTNQQTGGEDRASIASNT